MKTLGAFIAVVAFSTVAFASDHAGGHCTKDGKAIEAKDEAACKAAGGTWEVNK